MVNIKSLLEYILSIMVNMWVFFIWLIVKQGVEPETQKVGYRSDKPCILNNQTPFLEGA